MGNEISDESPADEAVGVLVGVVVTFTQRAEREEDHDGNADREQEGRDEQGTVQLVVERSVLAKLNDICRNPAEIMGQFKAVQESLADTHMSDAKEPPTCRPPIE